MKRPKSSLDNTESIVAHYNNHNPNYRMMRGVHFLCGALFNVNTVYEPGAKKAIEQHVRHGGQLLIAANHQKFRDPLVLASMIEREDILHDMRGNVTIPGNAQAFNNRLYGPIVRRSGAVPVFRSKDVAKLHKFDATDREEQRKIANRLLVSIVIGKMNKGMHGAFFPEGTRAKDDKDRDPRVLLPLLSGIGHVACGVDRPDNVLLVCTGIKFEESKHNGRNSTVAVAYPFEVAPTPQEVVTETGIVLQRAVDMAFAA